MEEQKKYDLEERTFQFAKRVRAFAKILAKCPTHDEDGKQVIRASGFVGANYIEANEAVSKKEFVLRIKYCRRECKESRYWLRLLEANGDEPLEKTRGDLIQESTELMKIFGAILRKSE